MKKALFTSCKWLSITAIGILSICQMSCSSDEWEPREVPEDYKPVFKEGKVWNYGTCDTRTSTIEYSYTIKGETTIKGKKYKKLYCTDEKRYGDQEPHYYAAVREESLRAFYVLNGNKEEKLMFDFGSQEEETFEIGRLPDLYIINLGITEAQDFLGTPRKVLKWGAETKAEGIAASTYYCWYEGIGNNPDLLCMEHFGWYNGHDLISCYEDGICIYDYHIPVWPYMGQ